MNSLDYLLPKTQNKVSVEIVEEYFKSLYGFDVSADKHWVEFKSQMTEDAEMWSYDDMGILCGSRGIVIIKDDHIIKSFIVARG